MKIQEHKRRAEVYRKAAEFFALGDGMCVAIATVLNQERKTDLASRIFHDSPETLVYRRELAQEVGPLRRFYARMNGSVDGQIPPDPDRVLIRGEILTRAAEYHEACVAAGRTL